jgi:hypothetical protein
MHAQPGTADGTEAGSADPVAVWIDEEMVGATNLVEAGALLPLPPLESAPLLDMESVPLLGSATLVKLGSAPPLTVEAAASALPLPPIFRTG